jgi:hypothetical protein
MEQRRVKWYAWQRVVCGGRAGRLAASLQHHPWDGLLPAPSLGPMARSQA